LTRSRSSSVTLFARLRALTRGLQFFFCHHLVAVGIGWKNELSGKLQDLIVIATTSKVFLAR
jgi:hypothetical protein